MSMDLADPGCVDAEDNDETNTACGEVETETVIRDDWGDGYCADVTVTNNTCDPIAWKVTVAVEGTVDNLWNGQYVQGQNSIEVQGDGWNSELAAGASTSFGFCAKRDQKPAVYQCNDGIDNDGDGLVDLKDPGCANAEDNDEYNEPPQTTTQCSDGVDNDGDGLVDLIDPGCANAEDNDETDNPTQTIQCNDGVDNDGDGLIDLADPDCENALDNNESWEKVSAIVRIADDWGTGYCADVSIKNNTAAEDIDWKVTFKVDGTLKSLWGALYEKNGDQLTVEGKDWNNIVAAGSSLSSIGFCVDR